MVSSVQSKINVSGGLLNTQSVGNKTFEIRDLINDENMDVLAVTETWLNKCDNAKIAEMTPITHTFLHNPRNERRGGGVGIFLRNTFKKVRQCKSMSLKTCEHMQVTCEIGGRKCIFVVVYRPPNLSTSSFIEDFRLYLETIDMVSANLFVCGDLNLWVDDANDRYASEFLDMMDSFNLINMVKNATSSGGHILDLVFCSKDRDKDLEIEVNVDDVCLISPVHKLVTFKIPLNNEQRMTKKITYRSKRNFISNSLITSIADAFVSGKDEICNHGFERKGECTTCLTGLYTDNAKEKFEEMCPILEKEIVIVDSAPWFDAKIEKAKKLKKNKERKWRRLRTNEAREEYKDARNNENKVIVQRKREYYRKKAMEARSDTSRLYLILDNLTGNRKKKKLPDGIPDRILANDFSDFFYNKIKTIVDSFGASDPPEIRVYEPSGVKLTNFRQIDNSVIKSVVKKAKLTNCDNDPLPVRDLVHSDVFDSLMNIYVEIVNCSITNVNFPSSEKRAIVKPILKGNLDPQCLSSYRPVSNLTILSKIIENVILDQLFLHLNAVQALPDSQSAYRRLYSTETTMCSVLNDLLVLMDNEKCGILILLDLSAAFDTVVHTLLLDDCRAIGIEGNALMYIQSYLENRTYCVQIGKSYSNEKKLERGVPQGSVLGPILFCIYTIELSHLLEKHGVSFKLFADDTQFYLSLSDIENAEEKISRLISDIGKWMTSKQLKLNENKTQCLIVGRHKDLSRLDVSELTINDNIMTVSKEVKDLGVLVDCNISLKSQINQTVRISAYHLRNIAFVRKYLDNNTIKMLVHSHVISKLDYCNALYYGLPNYLLKKLQLIMNRAARLIVGLPVRLSVTPTLIALHWLPIKARIIYKLCVMAYQALNFGKPEYIRALLEDFHIDTDMILRHGTVIHRLNEPRYNLELGFRAFEKSVPRLYNKLPETIKCSNTIDIFKKKLKTHLFSACYDLDDGTIRQEYKC